MEEEINILIIVICSCISFILCCFCFTYCKDSNRVNQKNRLHNSQPNLILTLKFKVEPIIEINITDDELKDEDEQYDIINIQPTGCKNV